MLPDDPDRLQVSGKLQYYEFETDFLLQIAKNDNQRKKASDFTERDLNRLKELLYIYRT